MKKLLQLLTLIAGLSAVVAHGLPINITVDSTGALYNGTGVVSKDVSGHTNNNPESNFTFLEKEIGYWNAAFDPNLPAAISPVAFNIESLGDVSEYTSIAGYNYVVFHFGKGNAGGQGKHADGKGGWYQAFYLGGTGGFEFSLPTVNGQNVGGFSSARYFNPYTPPSRVPDSGATVTLLGFGLTGLALLARRKTTK